MQGCRDRMDQLHNWKSMRESGWHWQTTARQSWNRFFLKDKHAQKNTFSLDLESKNRCKKRGKKNKKKHQTLKKGDTDFPGQVEKRYKDIEYNERHADLSEGKIVGTYHFPEFGTWGHPQGRWLRAHTQKKSNFHRTKRKRSKKEKKKHIINSLELTKKKKKKKTF